MTPDPFFRRLSVVLLLKNGLLVRSGNFQTHQVVGNPITTLRRLSSWNVDEVILLDISPPGGKPDFRRDDIQEALEVQTPLELLKAASQICSTPLAFGGQISSIDKMALALESGADKCVVTTHALQNPDFISEAAVRFGSQAVVLGIDAIRTNSGYVVTSNHASKPVILSPIEWAKRAELMGAGEIFLHSVERDGTATGFDLDLVNSVVEAVSIPVIACGGAGMPEHFSEVASSTNVSAIAAANIYHFTELSYPRIKDHLHASVGGFRKTALSSDFFPREPDYDKGLEKAKLDRRLNNAFHLPPKEWKQFKDLPEELPDITWCRKCTYPSLSATPLEFDSSGQCTGCQMALARASIPSSEWTARRRLLGDILESSRSAGKSRHDVVVAVSGGKDSYFQVHTMIHEFGLRPLLVTYDGNNWTAEGWRNLLRMREVFDTEHVVIRPPANTLRRLNLASFLAMGDMNWHSHVGIMTVPMAEAIRRGIPLVIYGEHGYADLSGQFGIGDFPEVTYRHRLEHFARGFEWTYFRDVWGFSDQELLTWQYPSDELLQNSGLRGIFLGNYLKWEPHVHTKVVVDQYGFESSSVPFDRTYRRSSNLDDMHENGVHDYLKFIKFGYGRATDHTSKDIREGLLTRAKAVELVRSLDPIKPSDLQRWLEYVGVDEDFFDKICDTFRDPRAWRYLDETWVRHIIG